MPSKPSSAEVLLGFMCEYGRAYAASGGPTSRMEEALAQLGRRWDFPTEVYGTPTGVFVSCVDEGGKTRTALARIRESNMNLEKLCWLEELLDCLQQKKISIHDATKLLLSPKAFESVYSNGITVLAAFMAGFALSFTAFAKTSAALICGLITVVTWWISGPGLKSRISSSIFRDFIGCAVTLFLAAGCRMFLGAPFEAYTIGGLIVLVPGLSLTTAISELADQNLVSGTAKLMQAILTLLAISLAYLLFNDIASLAEVKTSLTITKKYPISFMASLIGIWISISCFGVLMRVPLRSLPWATLTGILGWIVLRQFSSAQYIASASYTASLAVGLASLGLGYIFRMPSQVFSVPGIIAMLPGMLALTSFNSFVLGQGTAGGDLAMRVVLTCGGIVFGLFTARIPFAFGVRFPWSPSLRAKLRQ